MDFTTLSVDLRHGFDGFVTISELQRSGCAEVPSHPGVYLVVRPSGQNPEFLETSIGGHFKRREGHVDNISVTSGS